MAREPADRQDRPRSLDDDFDEVARHFGADEDQVRRDYAISHILGVLAARFADDLVFYGGTALSRTHLIWHRLSEDIDLVVPDRSARWRVASLVQDVLGLGTQQFEDRRWSPGFDRQRDTTPAVLILDREVAIKIQVIAGGYDQWPTEPRYIHQRYMDAPPAVLKVPTVEAIVGMKTVAWTERRAARDLYDLWALAKEGTFTERVVELYRKAGPGGVPAPWMFREAPTEQEWVSQLGTQTRLGVTAREALCVVRRAWSDALHQDWPTEP